MPGFLKFLRSTLVAGILFLLPLILVIAILEKALEIAAKVVTPLARMLPVHSVIGLSTPIFLAIGLLLGLCLLCGLVGRTRAAGRLVAWLEGGVLSSVPGYAFIRDMGQSMLGITPQHEQQAVLVRFDNSWQIAFLMERLADGRAAVFVPNAPSPWSGSVHIMAEDRVANISRPPAAALKCLQRLGDGSGALLDPTVKPRERPLQSGVLTG